MRSKLRQGDARNVIHQTNEMAIDRSDLFAGFRADDCAGSTDMGHRLILKIECWTLLVAVGYFEDEFTSVVTAEQEVLVPFAGQFANEFRDAVEVVCDFGGLGDGKPRSDRSDDAHSGEHYRGNR